MDIREYFRMLKRGWPLILLVTTLFVVLASAYLAATPKSYDAMAVLLVSTSNPATIADLQQGADFAANAVAGYAQIVDSSTVLAPAAAELRPQLSVDELEVMVTATVRPLTTLIDVTATGEDPVVVAVAANSVAASAARVIPALQATADGRALVRVQLIRPAVEPSQAVSPNVKRTLALGLVVGLFVGLAATIATQALDTRIRRVHDLRMLTGSPVLAVLPRVSRRQQQALVVRTDPTGPSGEAFRTLRTNVRFLDVKDRRTLVFAGVADDSDGAQVPCNLAWVLAEAGLQVLLVDLDLRQSAIGNAFRIETGPGIADVLAGKADLPSIVHEVGHSNLQIVLSGTAHQSPSELLTAPTMARTLRKMETSYDYVILHAPPLLSYTDAAVLAATAGGTLVTVAVGRTRAQELTTALTVLANVGVEPVGVVLTRAGRSAFDHKKARVASSRSRSWLARPMLHRFDWDWKGKPKPMGRHSNSFQAK